MLRFFLYIYTLPLRNLGIFLVFFFILLLFRVVCRFLLSVPEVVSSIGWFARFSRICQNKQSDSRGQQFRTTKQTNERLRIVQTTKALTASTLFWIGRSVGETRWDKTKDQNRQTERKCCYWRWEIGIEVVVERKRRAGLVGGLVHSPASAYRRRQTDGDETEWWWRRT